MRTDSPLVLDVRELLEHPGSRRSIAFDAPVPLGSAMARVDGDVNFDVTLEAIEGGVLVRGTLSGAYSAECRRCLNRFSRSFSFEGSEIYRPVGDVWEEGYVVKDGTIDLDRMARDAVGLNLPPNPLCREDCAGLCSRCGADLNEGPCDCGEKIDERWSALRDLGPLSG
jgi:uncharacterized protein